MPQQFEFIHNFKSTCMYLMKYDLSSLVLCYRCITNLHIYLHVHKYLYTTNN